jgi:hypothetical protein
MHHLRRWTAILAAAGGLWGLGLACNRGPDQPPDGHERHVRSQVLRDLIASREKMPDPQELQAQRRDLRAEVDPGEGVAQGSFEREQPEATALGTVEWVGDDELLVRDTWGVERDVRVEDDTRFQQAGREVSRRTVEEGAQVRVAYNVAQGEWVAREVELLRKPERSLAEESPADGALSQPVPK